LVVEYKKAIPIWSGWLLAWHNHVGIVVPLVRPRFPPSKLSEKQPGVNAAVLTQLLLICHVPGLKIGGGFVVAARRFYARM
jgi:hypothetical protein